MINKDDIYNGFLNIAKNEKDTIKLHRNIARFISLYLMQNLEITGIYTGNIMSVPPVVDPLSGTAKLKLGFVKIDSDMLLKMARKSYNSWYKSLCQNISITATINVNSVNIKLLTPVLLFVPHIVASQLKFNRNNTLQDNWNLIANTLYNDIVNAKPNNVSIPAVSNAGGVGIVNLLKIL